MGNAIHFLLLYHHFIKTLPICLKFPPNFPFISNYIVDQILITSGVQETENFFLDDKNHDLIRTTKFERSLNPILVLVSKANRL